MKVENKMNQCTICELRLDFEPWSKEGVASYRICPRCKCEFGYDDATEIAINRSKQKWIEQSKKEEN